MSVLLTEPSRCWKVPWINELIFLWPLHPGNIGGWAGTSESYATSVITVYFAGLKDGSHLDDEAEWELGIIQRGQIDSESLYDKLKHCNESLACYDVKDHRRTFYNTLLSQTDTKRTINGVVGKHPRVSLELSGILCPAQVLEVLALDRKNIEVKYLKPLDCSKICVKSKGNKPQVFRFSYNHRSPVVQSPGNPTFELDRHPGIKFPIKQLFEVYTFHKVVKAVKAKVAASGDATTGEMFQKEIEGPMVSPAETCSDLVVVGDPRAFSYGFQDSHLTNVDTIVQRVNWVNMNGDEATDLSTLAYEVFPKKEFRRSLASFSMHIRADLDCTVCEEYIRAPERKKFHADVEETKERLEGFKRQQKIVLERLEEAERTNVSLACEIKELRQLLS